MPDTLLPAPENTLDLDQLREIVEEGLRSLPFPEKPAELYDPVRYVLSAGGKRVRPLLTLLAASACNQSVEAALPAALAVEVFHNFTLVHDDIMDHADERRGRATVHKLWDESTAILVGDLMLGWSFRLLSESPTQTSRLYSVFNEMVALLCEGQSLDESFESRADVSVDEYLTMISGKTGALTACALELGGIVAGASDETCNHLSQAGFDLGRAFQIQDDLLDLTADHPSWGKTIGGDFIEAKKSYLLLSALERAGEQDHTWLRPIADGTGIDNERIAFVRDRLDALGVLTEAAQCVDEYTDRAITHLGHLPENPASIMLQQLTRNLAGRPT